MTEIMHTPSQESICRVCGNIDSHPIFRAKEMMFGTREEFDYFMCQSCGCLQITDIPDNIAKYYPKDYYSFEPPHIPAKQNIICQILEKQIIETALFQRRFKLSNLAKKFVSLPDKFFLARPQLLIRSGVPDFSSPILDIGCGSQAKWLQNLRTIGFSNLTGIDPFIDSDLSVQDIPILRIDASSFAKQSRRSFKLITLHHSLEHIPDQVETLLAIRTLLEPSGTCVIRIPTVSSQAWNTYGVNWVELDAPRHLYLHSKKSIETLAKNANLELYYIDYDTTAFEFYGSEQYLADIPLTSPQSLWVNPESKIFSNEKKQEFEEKARQVNKEGTAGRACFFFRRVD